MARDLRELRRAGHAGEARILGRSVGRCARASGELTEALVVEPVAGGRAGALTTDDPQEDADVLDQRRLVHLGTGETREARALSLDDRLDAVALRRGDRTLGELEDARHEGATPTWTLRKRPGAAPWLTCACWPGCPLPQFVSP